MLTLLYYETKSINSVPHVYSRYSRTLLLLRFRVTLFTLEEVNSNILGSPNYE